VVLASFAGQLPGDLAALPERLTAAMADIVRDSRSKVTRAPLGDLLAVAGCADASDDCLQQARALLEAGRVVAGDVESVGAGRVRVHLRLIAARQQTRRRVILLEGGSAAALEADFRAHAAAFWRDPDAKAASASRPAQRPANRSTSPRTDPSASAPRTDRSASAPRTERSTSAPQTDRSASAAPAPSPADEPAARTDLAVATRDDAEDGFSAGRVSPLAWTAAAAGAGVAAIGGALLLAAADKQGQIDDAPTDTPDDLAALVDLEESASTYARWGSVLVVVGAVTTVAGVAFVFKQGRDVERDGHAIITLSPSLLPGGAGAVLTWRGGP
jgi:hypothetical protein